MKALALALAFTFTAFAVLFVVSVFGSAGWL
jgi:hypothetical protein